MRIRILAAADEMPSLRARIAERQRELNAEIDNLLNAVIERDPAARPIVPVAMIRFTLNSFYLGYALDDLEATPLTNAEMVDFFTAFITRMRQG